MSGRGAPRRPIRVLHLRDSPWIDGPGRTILETAARIDRSMIDYQVGVLVARKEDPHPLIEALRARGLPAHGVNDPGGAGAEIRGRVLELIDQLQIDILHTSEFRSNLLGLICRRQRPLRLVSTAHGWITNDVRGKVYALADRILLRAFDHVIFVSHATRRRVPSWLVPESRTSVLHNALMTESYGEGLPDLPRRAPDPKGAIRLLNVGRLSPEKGQSLLLRAVAVLQGEFPGLQLSFAGIGPLMDELRRTADRLEIADRVKFLGYVSDMPRLYAETDLVIQSSFTEGLPNVLLEVAYLGVPVIATDVGGTREVVDDGVSGWLVKPGSVEALAAGIRRFLTHPHELLALARNGRSRIAAEFSFGARTELQARVYREVAWRKE